MVGNGVVLPSWTAKDDRLPGPPGGRPEAFQAPPSWTFPTIHRRPNADCRAKGTTALDTVRMVLVQRSREVSAVRLSARPVRANRP
jgi:hypothetical protein